MRKIVVAGVVASALLLAPGTSSALLSLMSAAVKGGAAGHSCSCLNLTNETAAVNFTLRSGNGTTVCAVSIAAGATGVCTVTGAAARACQVYREDGENVDAKSFLCTMTPIDGAGNPTVVIPVDVKVKRQ